MIDDEELSIFNAIRKENSEIISKNRFLEIEVGILKVKFFIFCLIIFN